MRRIKKTFCVIVAILVSGCATTSLQTYRAAGGDTICGRDGHDLGVVAVLPEVVWRRDQKEPENRQAMARVAMEEAFREMPCGKLVPPGGIRVFSSWSARPESDLAGQFSAEGIDTIVIIRVEELTPRLYITFSLPVLWAGSTEADFHIRVLATKTGQVLSDMRVKRSTGGPFNLRPAEWAGNELQAALRQVIGGTN